MDDQERVTRVVQERIVANCSVSDESGFVAGEGFFVKPKYCSLSGLPYVRFIMAYLVLCLFLKKIFCGKVSAISAKGQTVSYAFSSHTHHDSMLVRSWSWYRDFRLRKSRKKSTGLTVLFPWQRLRVETFAHWVLSQHDLAPALLAYSTATGMLLRAYPEAVSLEEFIQRGHWNVLNKSERQGLVVRVVSAVQKMHSLGVIHGDLAPGNILLLGGSFEKISFIDFENAWFSRKRVDYMSKEQMLKEEWSRMLERAEVVDKDLFCKLRNILGREEIG